MPGSVFVQLAPLYEDRSHLLIVVVNLEAVVRMPLLAGNRGVDQFRSEEWMCPYRGTKHWVGVLRLSSAVVCNAMIPEIFMQTGKVLQGLDTCWSS